MAITTFVQMIDFLENFTNLEKQTDNYTTRTYRLDRMAKLLAHLGNPERSFKKIHLAGSKGKGSTATYLATALTASGYKTGLFLSPHLSDYRERFTLAGTFFDDVFLVQVGNQLIEAVSTFTFTDQWGPTTPTTFELFCAYAYLLFKEAGCSWAVIETGLGGRLDATNTIEAEAVVLCPIELEHTKILGDTIEEIAIEKSKIIKEGQPVFIGYQDRRVMEIFLSEAQTNGAPVYRLDQALTALISKTTEDGEAVTYRWADRAEQQLLLSMRGSVQAQNSALALLVLRTLSFDESLFLDAFCKNTAPGRFQQLGDHPALYVDGAHTAHSLSALLASFSALHEASKTTIIYGALEDKDHVHMVQSVLQHASQIIISRPGTYKKSNIVALKALFDERNTEGRQVVLIEENDQALAYAYAHTPADGAILACGSFYLAGGIKEALERREGLGEPQLA
ncbi:MAG: cyanophycin synthetase [Sphaerochaeta sp.]|jgi:dihydrofolate synthase/folylpolyglutamate synthase